MGEVAQKCALCGCPIMKMILDMGLQPLSERHDTDQWYPLFLVQCQDCSLVQAGYVVEQSELFPPAHPYATGNTRALVRHFTQLAIELERVLSPGDLVVDIGANDGTLLAQFRWPQLRRVGVEPTGQSVKAAKRLAAGPGGMMYQRFFTTRLASEIVARHGSAKVVTATNVLAHVPDPHDFVRGVAELLADDGVFVTENHDVASVLEGLQIDTVYHEHLRCYSIGTLARLLAMHGLTVYRTEPVDTHGGSFRAWASKDRRDLQARAERVAVRLRELLMYATRDGSLVYGIGATTRATPLIHFAKLEPYVACVCEVPGSEKIGQEMPGTKIPVVDEEMLFEDPPDFALLFAWHIASDLIPKFRARGFKGSFIVPLPEPEIIDG